MALGSPPLTGASIKSTPFCAQAAAIFCETSGLMELMSMMSEPGFAPERMPSAPRTTSSTSGPSGSMVMTMEEREPTSAFDEPRWAPSATTASSLAGVRP